MRSLPAQEQCCRLLRLAWEHKHVHTCKIDSHTEQWARGVLPTIWTSLKQNDDHLKQNVRAAEARKISRWTQRDKSKLLQGYSTGKDFQLWKQGTYSLCAASFWPYIQPQVHHPKRLYSIYFIEGFIIISLKLEVSFILFKNNLVFSLFTLSAAVSLKYIHQ